MADVQPAAGVRFDAEAQVAIIGGGACGLVAALKARAAGAEVVVLERDHSLAGSTAMSSGFIPAPGTRFQRAHGIDDSPARSPSACSMSGCAILPAAFPTSAMRTQPARS